MDANQFLGEFGHIANAPGGVSNLRRMILSLAVQGKLSQFSVSDTPAKNTLDSLDNRRKEVLKEQELTSTKKHRNLGKAKVSFTVPPHWSWEFLAYVSSWPLKDGDWVESKDQNPNGGVRLIQLADIGVGEYKNKSARFLTESKAKELNFYFLNSGDVLIARLPDPLGRACIFPGDTKPCVTVVDVAVCRAEDEYINPQYLVHCINSAEIQRQIEDLATGTTRKRVATGKLGALSVPIPPLEEQSRIVARVDELMALCDQLEAQQQKRRTLQNQLRQATLQAIAASQSPRELQDCWQRIQANFSQLFSAPEDVADLRKLLSELAIYGVLDASDLPTHISVLDSYLESLARIKSGKRFAKINQVNEEVSLPSGWRWVLLEELLAGSESGWSPKCEAEQRRGDEWGVLKVSAVTWGEFKADENKRLPLSLEPRPECEVKPGDFMLSRANTAELVARSVIAPEDCPNKLLMSDKIVRLLFLDGRLKSWVNIVNNSEYARKYYKERATGTSDSMRNVSRQVIHELPIPLPPLDVQERIFKSLADLLAICDSLENKTKSRLNLAKNLAESSVASITGIAIEQEEETMKAPQTELVAPVRLGTPPDVKAQAPLATILAHHNGEMSAKDLWQRFGGEIDAFYAQLKTEVAHGWIDDPTYELDKNAPESPKKYPDGALVAKVLVKEEV